MEGINKPKYLFLFFGITHFPAPLFAYLRFGADKEDSDWNLLTLDLKQ